jgi:PhnB protein
MSKPQIQPYLFFAGRCDEALAFYGDAIGAKIEMLMRFNESPDPVPPGTLQAGFETKVMHCAFRVGDTTILASDGCDEKARFDGFSLALSVPTKAEAERAFAALARDGEIRMPLTETFWSPSFGMLSDRYGVAWMIMVPGDTAAQGGRP